MRTRRQSLRETGNFPVPDRHGDGMKTRAAARAGFGPSGTTGGPDASSNETREDLDMVTGAGSSVASGNLASAQPGSRVELRVTRKRAQRRLHGLQDGSVSDPAGRRASASKLLSDSLKNKGLVELVAPVAEAIVRKAVRIAAEIRAKRLVTSSDESLHVDQTRSDFSDAAWAHWLNDVVNSYNPEPTQRTKKDDASGDTDMKPQAPSFDASVYSQVAAHRNSEVQNLIEGIDAISGRDLLPVINCPFFAMPSASRSRLVHLICQLSIAPEYA